MFNNKTLYVAVLAIAATFFAALMALSVKYLSGDLNPIMICFYRCVAGLILLSPFIAKNNFAAVKSKNYKFQFINLLILKTIIIKRYGISCTTKKICKFSLPGA